MTVSFFFFFQAEDGIRDPLVTGVQTCALPISSTPRSLLTGDSTGMSGRSRWNGTNGETARARRAAEVTTRFPRRVSVPPIVHSSANDPMLLRMKSRRDQASAGGPNGLEAGIPYRPIRTLERIIAERLPAASRACSSIVKRPRRRRELRTATVRLPGRAWRWTVRTTLPDLRFLKRSVTVAGSDSLNVTRAPRRTRRTRTTESAGAPLSALAAAVGAGVVMGSSGGGVVVAEGDGEGDGDGDGEGEGEGDGVGSTGSPVTSTVPTIVSGWAWQ